MSTLRDTIQRTEYCISCKQQAYLIDDGWYTNTCVKIDDEGDYLAGEDPLAGAADTPMGFVCSTSCRAQAMYDEADKDDKEMLVKVLDACRVLSEYRGIANSLLRKKMGEQFDSADEFIELTSEAPWTNRSSRVQTLEDAIHLALVHLEYRALFHATFNVKAFSDHTFDKRGCSKEYLAGEWWEVAASIGSVMLNLKAADGRQ